MQRNDPKEEDKVCQRKKVGVIEVIEVEEVTVEGEGEGELEEGELRE